MGKKGKVTYYTSEKEINKVVNVIKQYSFDDLKKTPHYEFSVMEKNTNKKKLKKFYSQFDRINMVALRNRKNGKSNYDIYYELDSGKGIVYAIDIDKEPPVLINAFEFKRNLTKFIKSVMKRKFKH